MSNEQVHKPNGDAPLWVGFGLVLAVMIVFGQTLRHDFIFYDDGDYVTNNPIVLQGLTWEGLKWSLTAVEPNMWNPLTLISHMLDVSLFGLQPGLHHFTNVILHALNALLAFVALRRLTGDLWKPAIVAALFAVHPLRAESVAWVSERKDVLSGVFFFLGLWAYARYARTRRLRDYALVFSSVALGLCAKPMLVTFPFVLLLLDFWPLNRVMVPGATDGRQRFGTLVLEKVPLLVLTTAGSALTLWAQHATEATRSLEAVPIAARVANAINAYAVYVRQTFWPFDLAVMYPHPGSDVAWVPVLITGAVLTLTTIAVLFAWQRSPWGLVGWLWFVGMLVPVIGLIQVGSMAHSDRYTYLPQVGLFIALSWAVGRLVERHGPSRTLALASTVLLIGALAAQCYVQTSYWRNQITLFTHTVMVSPESGLAHFNLGAGYAFAGRPDLAEPHLREALRINARDLGAKTNLAAALIELGRPQEAVPLLEELMEAEPNEPEYQVQLALALYRQGKYGEALFRVKGALRIDPEYQRALILADQCRKALSPEAMVE